MRANIVLGDIDGCCISCTDRLPFLIDGDDDAFHAAHRQDKPIPQGVVTYRKYIQDPAFKFHFITSRPERAREYTLLQLQEFIDPSITNGMLIMRPDRISTKEMPDHILKPYLCELHGIQPKDIFLVFEDKKDVVQAWRGLGVVTYQTLFGDY